MALAARSFTNIGEFTMNTGHDAPLTRREALPRLTMLPVLFSTRGRLSTDGLSAPGPRAADGRGPGAGTPVTNPTTAGQGYAEVGALAVSYGEKSEILTELGRFQEALLFDEKALEEIQRWAHAGHTLSQEEVSVYRVNRGRLYLRLERREEAEKMLREALHHIHPKRRRVYRMFAEDALEEIEQWRRQATSPHHQLDWRWVERYRELDAFDASW
jgi:tetratricopeptide (TPR) repeat protein